MEATERDRRSLKDLAKLGEGPARPKSIATPDSSGFVDLAALAASDPNWLEQAVARAKAARVSISEKEEPEIDFEMVLPRRASRARRIAIGIVALAAIGTAAAFFVRARHRAEPVLVVTPPSTLTGSPVAAAVAPPPPAPVPTDIPPPVAQPAAAADPPATAEANAPVAAQEAEASPAAKPEPKAEAKRRGHGRTASRTPSAPAAAAAAPAPSPPASKFLASIAPAGAAPAPAPAKVVATPPSPGTTGALGDAMKAASGAPERAPAPAPAAPAKAASTGDLPDRPSPAVVTSALQKALPGARACLAAGSPAMHAVVTFGSNGAVSSVQASGTGASCVQGALSKARVPAFAQPTFTAGLNVRPN